MRHGLLYRKWQHKRPYGVHMITVGIPPPRSGKNGTRVLRPEDTPGEVRLFSPHITQHTQKDLDRRFPGVIHESDVYHTFI